MKSPRLYPSFVLAAALVAASFGTARAEEVATTIKFSNPAGQRTLKVLMAHGDVRITGADTQEVAVKSDSKVTNKPRKDGLRVITASSSFQLDEKDNVVTLNAMGDGWGGGSSDFRITVPRDTSVVLQNNWGGDIVCTNIAGDIDIKNMNGEIRLEETAGGITVDTMNGEVRASIRELRPDKPLSFSSMNGEVTLRVPTAAKANVRLRTQNGSVLTDFEDSALVTKTETTTRQGPARKGKTMSISSDRKREEARALENRARALAQAAKNSGADTEKMMAEADKMRADADRLRAEADKARDEVEKVVTVHTDAKVAPPAPPAAPGSLTMAAPAVPPVPAVPTITGGKLVTGTLNGGGPEISVSTMNGDITLRKLETAPAAAPKK